LAASGHRSEAERELVERCLAGEEAAWESFVESYGPVVRRAAELALARATGEAGSADVDDAVQAVLSDLVAADFAALRRFKWNCGLRTYVSVIAARAAYDLASRRDRVLVSSELDLEQIREIVPDAGPDPEGAASRAELSQRVAEAIQGLPPAQALSAALFYQKGLSVKEIAALRRVPYNTAASDLHRARGLLRGLFGPTAGA